MRQHLLALALFLCFLKPFFKHASSKNQAEKSLDLEADFDGLVNTAKEKQLHTLRRSGKALQHITH